MPAEHCGFVIEVTNLRPHPNADKLQLLDIFGTTTCVDLNVKKGDIGVYFPSGLQLNEEFCIQNHLLRKLPDGTPDKGYMDPNKRNVTTVRLRGEPSDGLYLPFQSFDYLNINFEDFPVGSRIETINGKEICCKYIPKCRNHTTNSTNNKHLKKIKTPIAPLFAEHADTAQLAYNLSAFKPGDLVEITLKMHGTSQRTGYLPIVKKMKKSILDRILHKPGKPIYEWGYVSGTRKTVLENFEGGFYGSNAFRQQHAKQFEGKLHKGETVYYEVVGYTDTGIPIMSSGPVPKENQKEYGRVMDFAYRCTRFGFDINGDAPQSDLYVYRMTMTNEDGYVVEYSPDFMRYRCEQMGVKTVPVFWSGYLNESDNIQEIAERYFDGPDPIGKTHVREGVVVRIVNRPSFTAYKHKNLLFKIITGIISSNISDTSELSDDILSEL